MKINELLYEENIQELGTFARGVAAVGRTAARAAGATVGGVAQMGSEFQRGYRGGRNWIAGHDYNSMAKWADRILGGDPNAMRSMSPQDAYEMRKFIDTYQHIRGKNVSPDELDKALGVQANAAGQQDAATPAAVNAAVGGQTITPTGTQQQAVGSQGAPVTGGKTQTQGQPGATTLGAGYTGSVGAVGAP